VLINGVLTSPHITLSGRFTNLAANLIHGLTKVR
jgi:hypothetical protein